VQARLRAETLPSGVRGINILFLAGGFVYTALAVAVYFFVPYVLWAVLVFSIVGIVGLTLMFNKLIWLLIAMIILFTVYLLIVA
jgi:hypothetical protein